MSNNNGASMRSSCNSGKGQRVCIHTCGNRNEDRAQMKAKECE